ncbi:MAG: hypothetical protein DRJ51_06665 [Thermoprotei archaeon]|nr:MAG: hypothetical protein DRJ51_06665 [Thermoprotei archaeon]
MYLGAMNKLDSHHRYGREVIKVGGSVLHGPDAFVKVAQIISYHALKKRIIVVVSAIKGTTPRLLEVARNPDNVSLYEDIVENYAKALDFVGSGEGYSDIVKLRREGLEALVALRRAPGNPALVDRILSLGERMSSIVMREALKVCGLEPRALTGGEAGILTNYSFGNARPLIDRSIIRIRERVYPLLDRCVPVIAGFIGETPSGDITTMGRGASDLTATLVGAAIEADEIVLFTDADGLMTGDPNVVPDPVIIPHVSLREADTMATFRVKNFHPLTFKPLMGFKGRVVVGRPSTGIAGTEVTSYEGEPPLKAVTVKENRVIVVGYGAPKYLDYATKLSNSSRCIAGRDYILVELGDFESSLDACLKIHSFILSLMREVRNG